MNCNQNPRRDRPYSRDDACSGTWTGPCGWKYAGRLGPISGGHGLRSHAELGNAISHKPRFYAGNDFPVFRLSVYDGRVQKMAEMNCGASGKRSRRNGTVL